MRKTIALMTRRLTLAALLCGAVEVALPAPAAIAAPRKKGGKKKPKKGAAPLAQAAGEEKAPTARTLLSWKKQGMSDADIAAKASEQGYQLTAKDKATLKKARARTLIAALEGGAPAEEPAAAGVRPIDLSKVTDPNDIDFDSVPPPSGVPQRHVAETAKPAAKKPLDRSLRPSAPFDEKEAQAAKAPAAAPAAKKTEEHADASGAPKRRVVFTAGSGQ